MNETIGLFGLVDESTHNLTIVRTINEIRLEWATSQKIHTLSLPEAKQLMQSLQHLLRNVEFVEFDAAFPKTPS